MRTGAFPNPYPDYGRGIAEAAAILTEWLENLQTEFREMGDWDYDRIAEFLHITVPRMIEIRNFLNHEWDYYGIHYNDIAAVDIALELYKEKEVIVSQMQNAAPKYEMRVLPKSIEKSSEGNAPIHETAQDYPH